MNLLRTAALLALSALLLGGCQALPRSSAAPLQQDALEATGTELEATYSRKDASATIMTIRGGARHPNFIIEPGIDSPYEFDYLILDRQGVLLSIAFGGSEAIQRDWNRYLENPGPINVAEHHADLFVALDAAYALAADPDLSPRFQWELNAIINDIELTVTEVGLSPPDAN